MLGWVRGNWAVSNRRENSKSLALVVSCQPMNMGVLSGAKTVMSRFDKVMVHSASHIGLITISVCLNVDMM